MQEGFDNFRQLKSARSPGHEVAHVLDNLNSAVRIFDEYGDFSEAEKLEVILSCLGHDLGRYVENAFSEIDQKDILFLMPALVGFRSMKKNGMPKPLQLRVLYDIASGPIPETKHRTADTVHQCDREYLAGTGVVARSLAYDVAVAGMELMVPNKEEFKLKLPVPESADDQWFLTQMEFFMRNVYPPMSPDGSAVVDNMKLENVVIEMLATEGKEKEFKQVFSPELGLVEPEKLHKSKKPIANEIFVAAQKEKENFFNNVDLGEYVPGKELGLIKVLVNSNNISLPVDFDDKLTEKLDHCSDQERKNLWLVIKYTLSKCHERRIRDLQKLEKKQNGSGVSAVVAKWLVEELQLREAAS